MSKKIIATIVVLLMILSIFSVTSITLVPKAYAHDELGPVFLRPGVADPYNPGFSLTLGTLRNNPEVVVDKQSAFSVLTDSEGDLMFDISVNVPLGYIRIWVPPDFTFTKDKKFSVWTDITNDYGYIGVSKRGSTDSFAPNWNRITIGRHAATTTNSLMYEKFVIEPGFYHVRLLGLKAPSAAGLYHFKLATDLGNIAVDDFPIIIVKGELNPAYITGLVDGGQSGLSGKVVAEGTTPEGRAVKGVAWFSPEDEVDATGTYTYWLFGLAAGTYDITVKASGQYPETYSRFTVAAGQSYHMRTVGPNAGPEVYVHVFSKHGRGTVPWSCLWQPPYGTNDPTVPVDQCGSSVRDILVRLYDSKGTELGFWGSDAYGYWGDGRDMGGTIGPTDPTASDYQIALLDSRGLPSTEWEGIPSDHADFVSGFQAGTDYSLKAFVTGYVMTEEDAFQRTFTISGDAMTVEMDLRRSNWFVIQAHGVTPTYDMSLAFTAVPTGTSPDIGDEAGLAVYEVPGGVSAPPIILEGWAEGMPDDYGLEPGTYDIKMYAADEGNPLAGAVGKGIYYIRSGEPVTASIALCNSPSTLSFRTRYFTLTLSLRSVDSEVPSQERPWTFPGAEIWVNFLDADGNVVASLDPTENGVLEYGLVQDDGWIGSPWYVSESRLSITWAGVNPPAQDDVLGGTYPTSLLPGQYSFEIYTFGYIMRRVFSVWVPEGGNGDIQADLVQGGMVRVAVDFKKEALYTNFNGFVRVEVFDKDNKLVGANIYGMASASNCLSCSPAGNYPDYVAANDFKLVPDPAEGSNVDGQRGYLSSQWYGVPFATWAGWPAMDPSDANRLNYDASASAQFDVYGFYWYYGGPSSRNEGLWANGWETTDGTHQNDYGIRGSRDIPGFSGGGLYTVKVFAFDPLGPDGEFGTADDWQSYYTDAVTDVEIPWGGGALISVTMNQMGRLSGGVNWLDMFGDFQALPWATVVAGSPEVVTYTITPIEPEDWTYTEPAYFMWLPAGTHDVSVSVSTAPQIFAAASSTVVVSDGWSGTYDPTLVPTGVPIPEFPASMLLVMLSALGASVYLLRRKRTPN